MAEMWDDQQLKLTWETRRNAPCEMRRGAAVAHGSVGYFSSKYSYDVFAYDSEKDDWSKLPECPQRNFGLAVINNLLTGVGGETGGLFSEDFTNRLVSFNGSKWVTIFPPMPTKRSYPAVISTQNYLIAAGGEEVGWTPLSTVEVINIGTREWYTAASLPEPVYHMSATACGGRLCLLGVVNKDHNSTRTVFTCILDSLLHSCHPPSQTPPHTNEAGVWQRIADVPMWVSTCTTLNGRVVAVGGQNSCNTSTADVYMYNADSDSWSHMGHMSTARSRCLVVGLRDCIIAVGGWDSSSVEVGYLQLSDTAEERHLAALELAIRQKGSLDKTIMQCVFVGIPRSGKSTLMKRMVGERPTHSSPSTGVVDKLVQVEIVRSSTAAASVSGSTWVKLSHDDEAVTVVMDTAQSHSGEVADNETHSRASVAVAAVHQTEPNSTTSGGRVSEQPQPDSVSEHRSQHQPHQSPTPTMVSTHPHLLSQSSSASSNTADLKPSVDMCKSALRKNPVYAARVSQEHGWMVYLTDTGGQIEFQELLPLLVSGPSVFFLVFRLDHDLNKRFTVVYVRPSGTMSEAYQSNFTVKEALLQTLASIASMGTYVYMGCGKEQVPLRPQVFFVGTHMDKVSRAKIDRIDRSLRQMVTSTGLYREGMIQFASESRMLLAVNNLSDDDSGIQQVREAVERLGSRGSFKVTAPPSWLIFSLTIRKHKDRVLSYEQCFQVARQCGITSRGELNEALWFLHTKVGLIRHFQGDGLEDLQKIVIQDPQVLFDRITDLVVETFTFDKASPVIREDFKKKGIFPFSTFEKISSSSDYLLTPSRLVKLLKYLHIIAPLEKEEGEDEGEGEGEEEEGEEEGKGEEEGEEGEKRYFMPCVLSHAQPAEPTSHFERISRAFTAVFRRSAEQSSSKSSLLVGFRCGYCPKGLFAALVVYLLANARSHGHKWTLQRDQIFKDQISFLVRPYDTVSITVQPKFFEITCTPAVSKSSLNRHFPLATTCGEVRRCIKTGIREVTSALHYTSDAAHYLAFYCPGNHRGPDPKEPHPAEINFHDNKPCTLQCVLGERGTFKLPPGHKRWFTEVSECSGRRRQSSRETGLLSTPLSSSTAATGTGTTHPRIGDRPEMWQLQKFVGVSGRPVRVVEEVSADWEKLALALHFRGGIIRAVRENERQVESACRRILDQWLEDGEGLQPVTWETLVEALVDIEHGALAGDLRRELEP